ncbi:MAG: winged helix-turn-helix transcriptional regulator [bacterium]|nr:winged helix-turn-helix transcriptional regulator [bacterium]
MDTEALFTEQRWNILRSLSEQSYSPLQLAGMLNTTMANISQQLRLLEAANIVKKHKIPNRDRGKPRSMFSLANDHAYLISAMNGFADKRLLQMSEYHEIILRIWFIDNPEWHYYVEKFYWKIEPYMDQIQGFAAISNGSVELVLVSEKPRELEKKICSQTIRKPGGESKEIKVKVLAREEAVKFAKQHKAPFTAGKLTILHDPESIFLKISKNNVA